MQETQETRVWSLGLGDPLKEGMATTPVFLPRKSHGQRSLVGCSPWGQEESAMTEHDAHACSWEPWLPLLWWAQVLRVACLKTSLFSSHLIDHWGDYKILSGKSFSFRVLKVFFYYVLFSISGENFDTLLITTSLSVRGFSLSGAFF